MGFFGDLFRGLFGGGSGGSGGSGEFTALQSKKEQLQAEVDVLAQEANSRLDDLRKNELEQSPAYSKWVEGGSVAFGVRGKTYQEVQSEFWRTKNFLDAKTSTVSGAKDVLSKVSELVGVDTEMTARETANYFNLAERIKEYYEMSGQSAMALDYQAIWEVINQAIKIGAVTLDRNDYTVNEIERILEEIKQLEMQEETLRQQEDNIIDGGGSGGSGGGILGAITGFFRSLFGGLFG